MSETCEAEPFVARLNWRQELLIGVAVLLLVLAWQSMPWAEPADSPWTWTLVIIGFFGFSAFLSLHDRAPRLIVAADGLRWRRKRKAPLHFLAWDRIASASIAGEGEDGVLLRLALRAPPVLEQQASGRAGPYEVDIPIAALDCSRRALMAAIHRQAPHLFTRVSQRG